MQGFFEKMTQKRKMGHVPPSPLNQFCECSALTFVPLLDIMLLNPIRKSSKEK